MPDDYTLADLARLADVTPRTVRYYVAQGLLPSPEAAGPSTRYGDGHLARLRLIRRLQRDHLPLAEIRLRLERLGDDAVIATVSALDAVEPEPSREAGDTLGFVRQLMAQTGVRPTTMSSGSGLSLRMAVAPPQRDAWDVPAADREGGFASPAAPPRPAPSPAASIPASPAASEPSAATPPASPGTPIRASSGSRPTHDRSTWERLVIAPDVELHVRRPLDRTTNKRVDQLERIARELFEDP
jgi:DNA-binding transcriptional MerR regulator